MCLVNILRQESGGVVRRVRRARRRTIELRRREIPPGVLLQHDDTPAARFTWRWPSTLRTWKSCRRWWRARCAPRQDRRDDPVGRTVVPIVVHGDAAFAGQGVVMETFQMSQTRAYQVRAGRSHIVASTTRSALPRACARTICAPRSTALTSPRWCRHRSSTSTAMTPKRWLFVTQLAVDFRNRV